MNAEDYADIIKQIRSELSIQTPDMTLIRNVTSFCKSLNMTSLTRNYKTKTVRNRALAQLYLNSIRPKDDNQFDYESYLRNINTNEETKSLEDFGKLTKWIGHRMPTIASKSVSVLIDSRNRKATSLESSVTDFQFQIVPRHTQINESDGNIVVNQIPTQITYFKITRIMLPYSTILRARNFSSEITLSFTGLRNNGILARESTYHFVFTYDKQKHENSSLVELIPVNAYCKFSPPLQVIDDLSLQFNDPIFPIHFPADRLMPSLLNYTSVDGRIVFDAPHGLSTGDVISISDLKTFNDAANVDLLNKILDPRGIIITEVDTYIIATNINFSRLVSPDNGYRCVIQVLSRSFRFPLEIGYQE